MARNPDKRKDAAAGDKSLFGDGWLDEQLTAVVRELASRPVDQQPRLTGARSASMTDPAWLRTHGA